MFDGSRRLFCSIISLLVVIILKKTDEIMKKNTSDFFDFWK